MGKAASLGVGIVFFACLIIGYLPARSFTEYLIALVVYAVLVVYLLRKRPRRIYGE